MQSLDEAAMVWQKPPAALSVAQHSGAVTVTLDTCTGEPVAFLTSPIGGEPQVTLAADSWAMITCISVALVQPAACGDPAAGAAFAPAEACLKQCSGLIWLQKSSTALILEKTAGPETLGQVPHFTPHFCATVKPAWRVVSAQSAVSQKSPASFAQFTVAISHFLYAQTAL